MLSRFLVQPPFSACLALRVAILSARVTFSHPPKVFVFSPQVIFNAQKTSVPGDLILVPGATEKISFSQRMQAAVIFQG